jgi:hypothetical protein
MTSPSQTLDAAFTQWKSDYDADPEAFASHADFVADPPASYGERATRYLFLYLDADDLEALSAEALSAANALRGAA